MKFSISLSVSVFCRVPILAIWPVTRLPAAAAGAATLTQANGTPCTETYWAVWTVVGLERMCAKNGFPYPVVRLRTARCVYIYIFIFSMRHTDRHTQLPEDDHWWILKLCWWLTNSYLWFKRTPNKAKSLNNNNYFSTVNTSSSFWYRNAPSIYNVSKCFLDRNKNNSAYE